MPYAGRTPVDFPTAFEHCSLMGLQDDPCDLPAFVLAIAIAARRISAREVLEAHLDRIAARDESLCAFVTVDAEGARRQADALDQASAPIGPLHGVPVAVKDLTDVAGLRTTYGSLLFADHRPMQDDLVVARLKAAGAVVIGKSNTPEFGFGAICGNRLCGPTRNPFDETLTSGGSSGGSAVAVATGMAAIGHGTDFGGSVRTPASFCDVVSIRPTPGLIPVPMRPLGWDMLASHGFLTRSVADARLTLEACAGADARDPLSLRSDVDGPSRQGRPRLAVTDDFGVAPVARAVRGRFATACNALAAVADVERSDLICDGAIETFRTLRAAHIFDSYGPLLKHRRAELTPTVIWNIEAGADLSAQDYLLAERQRTAIYRTFRQVFDRADFIVAPAASVAPWPNEVGEVTAIDGVSLATPIDYLAVTFIVTLVGCPVLTLPTPRGDAEFPFGVQIIAAPGQERALFDFGEVVERELGFAHRRPPP